MPLPIKRTQSVGVNHLLLGIAITVAQDNYEVLFKKEFYERFQIICQKHLIPKVEYFNTSEQLKLVAIDKFSSRHRYCILSKNHPSYAEHYFLILSMINLPDISQFEG